MLLFSNLNLHNFVQPSPDKNPCDTILKVTTNDSVLTIDFSTRFNTIKPYELSSYFGYSSNAFDQQYLIPPGAGINPIMHNKQLQIEFPFLFLENYTGTLFCINPRNYHPSLFIQNSITSDAETNFEVNFSVTHFHSHQYTEFDCHGISFSDRWCEVKNILWNQKFVISTPTIYNFPNPFFTFGGRSIPFEADTNTEFGYSFVKTNLFNDAVGQISYDHFAVFSNFGNNRATAFDIVFSTMLPLHSTLKHIRSIPNNSKPIFYMMGSPDPYFDFLVSSITGKYPYSSPCETLFIQYAVFGMDKSDENPNPNRSMEIENQHVFRQDSQFTAGFAEKVRSNLKITSPKSDLPIVTFYTLDNLPVQNIEEISSIIKSSEKFDMRIVPLENYSLEEAISFAVTSSIIIGRTGVGLEHMLWSNASQKVLIELRPPHLECDDRFQIVSNIAQASYFSVKSNTPENDISCHQNSNHCYEHQCRSQLFQQTEMRVDIQHFAHQWESIMRLFQ